jgi:type II secretory pathway component PulK
VPRAVDRKNLFASLSLTGATLLGSLLVCALVVPSCLGMIASRWLEYLKNENAQLRNQVIERTAEEAGLLSPTNVEQWAGNRFVPPAADRVTYVEPSKESYARLDENTDTKQAR